MGQLACRYASVRKYFTDEDPADQHAAGGLYKFANPVDPRRLKPPGFNP
jgi:hypothetical protein